MEPIQSLLSEITVSYNPDISKIKPSLVTCSEDSYKLLVSMFSADTILLQEMFVVLYLNRANKVKGAYKLSTGGITGTVADIRLILSVALKTVSTGIIISHNHPSGNLRPSKQDELLTRKIKDAADLLDLKLLDHIIISGEGTYFSFADEGLL